MPPVESQIGTSKYGAAGAIGGVAIGGRDSSLAAAISSSGPKAQGGEASSGTKTKRTPRKKDVILDGTRKMTIWRVLDGELDDLGAADREVTRYFAYAAFALGVAVDLGKDFMFDPPIPGTMKGFEIALFIMVCGFCVLCFREALIRRKTAETKLKKIKDSHDFS